MKKHIHAPFPCIASILVMAFAAGCGGGGVYPSAVFGVAVSDGTVCCAGAVFDGALHLLPCYWTCSGGTSSRSDLSLAGTPGTQGKACGIAAVGADLYISGFATGGSVVYPGYWLVHNSTTTVHSLAIPAGKSYAHFNDMASVGVTPSPSGGASPVWFVGTYRDGAKDCACYWTDGAATAAPRTARKGSRPSNA